MIANSFPFYKHWFSDYVRTFLGNGAGDENIRLKIDHTLRVCDEITLLGSSLGLIGRELVLAQICALFHDIGRFEQYKRYATFADHESEDHARLGVAVLQKQDALRHMPDAEKELVIQVIACHNHARLPRDLRDPALFYARLLRDADKLDIWRVVVEYYLRREHEPNAVIELNLPDTPSISPEVLNDLKAGQIVTRQYIHNLNDFKLLQVGWIYDVNFPITYRIVKERNYLNSILDKITSTPELTEARLAVEAFLNQKLSAQ